MAQAHCYRHSRPWLSFRAINRKDRPGYDPSLQRHHLLPRQHLSRRCFGRMFESIGLRRAAFDNFRANGLLLPATEEGAIRLGLPLHRGPHRDYSAMVIERVGTIERGWSESHARDA
ncbi:MAG: AHH domain-containing protein [Erythrobacter sp.]